MQKNDIQKEKTKNIAADKLSIKKRPSKNQKESAVDIFSWSNISSLLGILGFIFSVFNGYWLYRQTAATEEAAISQVASYRLQRMGLYVQYGNEHDLLLKKNKLNQPKLTESEKVRLQYLQHLFEEITDEEGHLLFPMYIITCKSVFIRESPSENADKIGILKKGTKVKVINEITRSNKYSWFEVEAKQDDEKFQGWVYAVGTMKSLKEKKK